MNKQKLIRCRTCNYIMYDTIHVNKLIKSSNTNPYNQTSIALQCPGCKAHNIFHFIKDNDTWVLHAPEEMPEEDYDNILKEQQEREALQEEL